MRKKHFNPIYILGKIVCLIRSYYYSSKIDRGAGRIVVTKPLMPVRIKKFGKSILEVNGVLKIGSHLGGTTLSIITLGEGAILKVNGDFTIGHGIKIFLGKNSELFLGGREKESESGISCDTTIMVEKKITIGKDFLCAWGVFISDSDWHSTNFTNHQEDVMIGDHVWVANSTSILKGCQIAKNCIIASHSKVTKSVELPNCLIAGIPAKIVKQGVSWNRDISRLSK